LKGLLKKIQKMPSVDLVAYAVLKGQEDKSKTTKLGDAKKPAPFPMKKGRVKRRKSG
jgi:hypothetical protein